MLVEIKSDWKEYTAGEVIDVNEAIASQLYHSGIADILIYRSGVADVLKATDEKTSIEKSIQLKKAELARVDMMIAYYEVELKKLNAKKKIVEKAIEELEAAKGESEIFKEVKSIPRDKMLRRPNISKEVKKYD